MSQGLLFTLAGHMFVRQQERRAVNCKAGPGAFQLTFFATDRAGDWRHEFPDIQPSLVTLQRTNRSIRSAA